MDYDRSPFLTLPIAHAHQRPIPIDQGNLWNSIEYNFLDGFRTLGLNGFDSLNECVFFHPTSRTLVLTDTAVHFDESFPWRTQLTAKIIGGYKSLTPSLLERIATTEKEKVRRSDRKDSMLGF